MYLFMKMKHHTVFILQNQQSILVLFPSSRVLECHLKNCLAINHAKSVLLPEENGDIDFQNFKRLAKAPFIIYCDFECVLIP